MILCRYLRGKNLQHITSAPSISTTEVTLTFRLSLPPLTYPARSCFVVSCNKFQFTVYLFLFLPACNCILLHSGLNLCLKIKSVECILIYFRRQFLNCSRKYPKIFRPQLPRKWEGN